MAQPFKHPTSGIFHIRRKVPKELQVVLGREYKKSLGTRDPDEAKRKHGAQWLEADALFARARVPVISR
jgi:hypothetical protein